MRSRDLGEADVTSPRRAREPTESFDELAERVLAQGILSDPWVDGKPRLSGEPIWISETLANDLGRAAERIAEAYDELGRLCLDRPALLGGFLGLSPYQQAMWLSSAPRWHGIARADLFVTAAGGDGAGLACTELNSDTPTGEAEAVVLGELLAPEHPGARDPNVDLGERFLAMVEAVARGPLAGGAPRTAGLVYPTEFTEDLSLVRLYREWLSSRGWSVVLGSPYNLSRDPSGAVRLFDRPCALLVRHYKTDWWGERASVWDDGEIPDADPLAEALGVALGGSIDGAVAIVNPFGAVLPQNKRTMALFWEQLHAFSPATQDTIRRLIPVTARLETMSVEELVRDRALWVIKSDYGSEGDEVIVGARVTDELWSASLSHARKGRWVAQRYFAAEERTGGEIVNYGVFVIAGRAAGIYGRTQKGPTDDHAVSAPVLIGPPAHTAPPSR